MATSRAILVGLGHDRYHHGDLRNALIDSSLALIGERGPEGFTLREVARRAGVSHTAPYRHFEHKEDLLAAVAEIGFEALRSSMLKSVRRLEEASDRLAATGVAYVSHALRHPAHFEVMFSQRWDEARHPDANRAATSAFLVLIERVQECQMAGLFGGNAREQARIAWSLVHGIATLGIHQQFPIRGRAGIERMTSRAVDSLIRGFAGSISDLTP